MSEHFFRFPHTPHLVWLGKDGPREDKVLSAAEVHSLLASDVVVEEKLDGANLGLSLASDGSFRVQNRGQYMGGPFAGQFSRLSAWIVQHEDALRSVLTADILLFGEWCAARHSLDYAALPDWFLLFDVYDRRAMRFWSSARRNALAFAARLAVVPEVAEGKLSVGALVDLVTSRNSHYRFGPLEGVVIRRESAQWCEARAKLVRADFSQAIELHWRKRALEWNCMAPSQLHDR